MTRTSILLATTFAAALAVPSIAAAQNAAQWEGFYAGLGIDRVSGEVTFPGPLLPNTTTVSVYGGYNFAVGADVIVGGELAYTPSTDFDVSPFTTVSSEDAIVIRARGGYATGTMLFYGTLGYVTSDITTNFSPVVSDADGMIFGLGVEAAISSNMSVRAEYNFMTLEEDTPFYVPPGSEFDIEGFSVGFSFRF